MPFNAEKFAAEKMEPRREKVEVAALAQWFDEGEPAVWEVRGLTASELTRCSEAEKRQGSMESIIAAITKTGDQADAIRKAIGLSQKGTPGEVAKRIEMLVAGSVAPTVTQEQAVVLAERFPVDFIYITNKITVLTGQGFDLVKPAAASKKTKA